jgi:predicted esterase
MITTSKRIAISKTARYYITGKPSTKINSVWFVLHGYGQLAEDFIKYFEPIKDETMLNSKQSYIISLTSVSVVFK